MFTSFVRPLEIGLFALVFLGVGCSSTPVPLPGTWNFNMEASATNLSGSECATSGGFSSGGEASVNVNALGDIVTMNLSGQTIVFYDHLAPGAQYKTYTRTFPVLNPDGTSGTGNVWFDFTANDEETLSGTLHWNNLRGCRGDYPFTMTLLELELPDPGLYVLSEGTWDVNIDSVADDCGAGAAVMTGIPDQIDLSNPVDLDTGESITDELLLDPWGVILGRVANTNVFTLGSGPSFDPGLPQDADGDVNLDFEDVTFDATMEMWADGPDSALGTIYASGGGCNITMMVNMSFSP